MSKIQPVRDPVKQGRVSVFQNSRHFRVNRSEDEYSAASGIPQAINLRLQKRCKRPQRRAVKILKFIERHDNAAAAQFRDPRSNTREIFNIPGLWKTRPIRTNRVEIFQRILKDLNNAPFVAIRDLNIERRLILCVPQNLLHECGLTDAPSPRDRAKKEPAARQDAPYVPALSDPAVKGPGRFLISIHDLA